ncbi:MAG: hypothetical protein Q6J68_02145 [Thermostichales cyanobacterium SZTDM-1c_bins_54]
MMGRFWATLLATMVVGQGAWALPIPPRPSLRQLEPTFVLRVLNYNTLIVQSGSNEQIYTVRLVGVAPLPPVNLGWERLTGQVDPSEYLAGQFLQDQLNRQTLHMEVEPNLPREDGIVPVYLWRGEQLVNQDILFFGHGLLDQRLRNTRYEANLVEAAATARRQGRGIWNFFLVSERGL